MNLQDAASPFQRPTNYYGNCTAHHPPLCFSSGRKAESAESIVVQSTAPVPIKSSLRRDRESANREENAC